MSGQRMLDGYQTIITFGSSSAAALYEIEVTPPSIEAGGPIDTTTMRNAAWRTMSPKKLKTFGEAKIVAAYDPAAYTSILAMIGVNQTITCTFPDGTHTAFKGWIDSFKPTAHKEGEMPRCEVVIIASNSTDVGAESAPTTP